MDGNVSTQTSSTDGNIGTQTRSQQCEANESHSDCESHSDVSQEGSTDSDTENRSSQDSSRSSDESSSSSDGSYESSDDYNENKLEDKKKKTQTIDERNLIEKFYCADKGVIYEDAYVVRHTCIDG